MDKALMWYPENADATMEEVKIMLKQYVEYYLAQSSNDSSTKSTTSRKPK